MIETNTLKNIFYRMANFPPHHHQHLQVLKRFFETRDDGSMRMPFDYCVFIMTKFPDKNDTSDQAHCLRNVIDLVKNAISAANYFPRIADDKSQFHAQLWDNVELHMLGCKRGIAIVEDKYKPELNPNVAMEWGWMRGMGREVLYLEEESFKHHRADIGGLIKASFRWQEPEKTILGIIKTWLANNH